MTLSSLKEKSTYAELGSQLRYAFYCMFHPADGFWCITREKKASIASANIWMALFMIIEVLRAVLTNFQFYLVPMEYFNAVTTALSPLLIIVLWSVGNWGFTTLMNGKGRLPEIYIATVYSFVPIIVLNTIGIVISHLITFDEGPLYDVLATIAMIWSVLLVLVAIMQIHDYTLAKAVACCFLGILGMGFIIFVFLLFFSLISDAILFFVSLANEIIFRLY